MLNWNLNGIRFPFKGISQDKIDRLVFRGWTNSGVPVYTSKDLPSGTITLEDENGQIARIDGSATRREAANV